MSTQIEKAKKLILNSQSILILSAEEPSGDAASASLAFSSSLNKLDKKVYRLPLSLPQRISFLKEKSILPKEIILTIDTQGKKIKQLSYAQHSDKLNLHFILTQGTISIKDITLTPNEEKNKILNPDLIITLGIQNLEDFNLLLNSNKQIQISENLNPFILNLDFNPNNERFGQLNLIFPNAVALSEIVYDILSSFEEQLIETKEATFLLCGLICATHNFAHPTTTSAVLRKAARLLELGADHQFIIRALYKSRPLPLIHLLGRALQKLRYSLPQELIWTTLTQKDFQETQTDSSALPFLLDEFRTNFWQFPSCLILWESYGSGPIIKGLLSSKNKTLIATLLDRFEGITKGTTALFLIREKNLAIAEQKILQLLS